MLRTEPRVACFGISQYFADGTRPTSGPLGTCKKGTALGTSVWLTWPYSPLKLDRRQILRKSAQRLRLSLTKIRRTP